MEDNIKVRKFISKEELLNYPTLKFGGKIKLITNEQEAKKWANYLSKFNLLGFDTESVPFRVRSNNQLALIQLCNQNECFLFRVKECGLPEELIELLENENILKIGVDIKGDFKEITKLKNFTPNGFIDLQKLARGYGVESISLSKLSAIFLGKRVSKRQQRSNWGRKQLTASQMIYAATDAWVALQIFLKIINTFVINDKK